MSWHLTYTLNFVHLSPNLYPVPVFCTCLTLSFSHTDTHINTLVKPKKLTYFKQTHLRCTFVKTGHFFPTRTHTREKDSFVLYKLFVFSAAFVVLPSICTNEPGAGGDQLFSWKHKTNRVSFKFWSRRAHFSVFSVPKPIRLFGWLVALCFSAACVVRLIVWLYCF